MGMRTMDGVILDEDKRREQIQSYMLQSTRTEISHTNQIENNHGKITDILVTDREQKIALLEEQELCDWDGIRLRLTDTGMDLYNSIITELMV